MGAAQEALFAAEDVPATAPFVPDWGVVVHDTRISATTSGAEWWLLFSSRFIGSPRMTLLGGSNPMGSDWHVACDSKEDAQSLAEHMVTFGGIPKSAVQVRRLTNCKGWS